MNMGETKIETGSMNDGQETTKKSDNDHDDDNRVKFPAP